MWRVRSGFKWHNLVCLDKHFTQYSLANAESVLYPKIICLVIKCSLMAGVQRRCQ